MAVITLVLILTASVFSINYMQEKKGLAEYYALLTLLFIGLVGVFITSNLMLESTAGSNGTSSVNSPMLSVSYRFDVQGTLMSSNTV